MSGEYEAILRRTGKDLAMELLSLGGRWLVRRIRKAIQKRRRRAG